MKCHKIVYRNQIFKFYTFMMLDMNDGKINKKKSFRGIYLVGYLNEVIMVHSIVNVDCNKEIKEVQ